jgi:pyruvate kinase
MSRTKIVCTLGPASARPEILEQMLEAGMSVARLNFSHGDHASHARMIRMLRETAGRLGRSVAILQDLSGPKIRIGRFSDGPIDLHAGDLFTLTTRDAPGNCGEVSVNYDGLARELAVGDPLLLSDGALEFEVVETTEDDVRCRVVHGGTLSSNKGINLPTRSMQIPSLTGKDEVDLAFGLSLDVDFVALSFVRNVEDIRRARELMHRLGKTVPVIAKIEKHEAVGNIDDILTAADGIMVARGDLGIEIPLERVPGVQKTVIEKANGAAKPVITATQMLGSMVENPRPTRAEVTDITNAILDGTDAIMLSEETAVGEYPVRAVQMMQKVCVETETYFPYTQWLDRFDLGQSISIPEALSYAACRLADHLHAKAIIVFTSGGATARLISKYRPHARILAVTSRSQSYCQLSLAWGVDPVLIDRMDDTDETLQLAGRVAEQSARVRKGERYIITGGLPVGTSGSTNTITTAQL